MKKLILCLSLLALAGCVYRKEGPNCHKGLTFYNNTETTLYAEWCEPGETMADLVFARYHAPLGLRYSSGEYRNVVHSKTGSIYCIEERYRKTKYISFFVFDGEVIENNDWNTIVENDMFLQRYDLSLADMRKLNWRLSFPPDERMKDVKMWPAYGTYPPPPNE